MWNSAENVFARSGSFREGGDDEEALRWAALERLPTYARVRRDIFRNVVGDTMEIDVGELEAKEQKLLLDRPVSSADDDPEQFFDRMRRRFDAVALNFPKIEVRFQNLKVEAFVHVGSRALPTIPNFVFNMTEGTEEVEGFALDSPDLWFQNSNESTFSTVAFTNMKKLKFLKLSYVELNGEYKHLPKELIWLSWRGFPLESIPNDFFNQVASEVENH